MRILLLFFIFFTTLIFADDINTRTFTKILINGNETTNIYGDTLVIGNQLLCQNDADGATCQDPEIGATNNSINQHKVRIDTTDEAPLSNSMARLDLQPGDKIIWAGLYWSARIITTTTDNPGADEIYMKTPGSDSYTKYTSISEKYNWFYDSSGDVFDYGCMQDVTDVVANAGAGEYYVGGIQATDGDNRFASWALLVVVENYNREFRNISLYDGFEAVYGESDSYPDSVTVTADGFLTPRDGTVNSSLIVYTGESESGLTDSATITDSSGDAHYLEDAYNDPNDIFNASISTDGVFRSDSNDSGIADPNFQNVIGTDIDKLQVDIFDNLQTSTDITISSGTDRYTLNMFALSTELYVPKFCYDYAYKQQGVYFTETNDGTQAPRLVGDVIGDEPIEVTVFIRNLVDSDLNVTDMNVSVIDINTTQLRYTRETTKLALNSLIAQDIDDSSLSVSDSYIKNIPIGTMSSNDYFYTYYTLDPQRSDINDSIQVFANYNLTLNDTTLSYSLMLGRDMEMCSTSNFKYAPATGIYNIVHQNYYNDTQHYYNLPTQVTKREGNFKILVLDPDDPDHNTLLSDHNITYVDVEMIDASAFHDTNASCNEQASSISETVGLIIDANITSYPFDKQTIQDAIDNGLTDLTQTSDFYSTARQNSAFRVTYYENAYDNGLQTAYKIDDGGVYQMVGWQESWGGEPCVGDVNDNGNSDNNNNDKVADYCQTGNGTGNNNLSSTQVEECTRCISYPRYICSRDNFAIRPQSFLLKIDDQNQSNPTMQLPLTSGYSGSVGATAPVLNLAAGYNYNLEINASNYIDNTASFGYTRSFGDSTPNDIAIYTWEPRTITLTAAANNCNDDDNKSINNSTYIRFINGVVDTNTLLSQTGEYRLHLLDTTWTAVDSDPNFMTHHTSDYFASGLDCADSNATQLVGSTTLNGCNISSTDLNPSNSFQYNDFNVTLHPYKFNVTNSITLGKGLGGEGIAPNASFKPFVYMANMSDDENMSVHLNTIVTAQGEDLTTLTNFVDGCFAKPINLEINATRDTDKNATLIQPLKYNYIVHKRDSNGTILVTPTDTNLTLNINQISTKITPIFTTTTQFFQQDIDGNAIDMNGSAQIRVNLNFTREVNVSVNPEDINFTTIKADDNTTVYTADLNTSYYAEGNTTVNQRVLHYYGRTIAPKITVICNTSPCRTGMSSSNNNSMKELISYVIYCNNAETTCNDNLLLGNIPNGAKQVADARWYENTAHDKLYTPGTDGTIGPISEVANTGKVSEVLPRDLNLTLNNNYEEEVIIKYTGPLPYDAKMQMQSSPWLIYNEKDANATTNEFFIRFTGDNAWSGKYEENSTTDTKFSPQTSRRIMW